MILRRLVCAAVLVLAGASSAYAQNSCSVGSTNVSFPGYSVFNTSPTDSTGSVSYNCTLPGTITIDLSKGSSASYAPRTMTSGANSLSYNLYLDSARTSVWGDGSGGTGRYSASALPATPVTVTIYARIPARADVAAGAYTDTITATFTF